jgi:3-hydroxy-3-methylglutaryl CoA synthase
VNFDKYCFVIYQEKCQFFLWNEDIVIIPIHAAEKILSTIKDKNEIGILIFSTESLSCLLKFTWITVHFFEIKTWFLGCSMEFRFVIQEGMKYILLIYLLQIKKF